MILAKMMGLTRTEMIVELRVSNSEPISLEAVEFLVRRAEEDAKQKLSQYSI